MRGLFPEMPDHWDFTDTQDNMDEVISEIGDSVEILFSARIEAIDEKCSIGFQVSK